MLSMPDGTGLVTAIWWSLITEMASAPTTPTLAASLFAKANLSVRGNALAQSVAPGIALALTCTLRYAKMAFCVTLLAICDKVNIMLYQL